MSHYNKLLLWGGIMVVAFILFGSFALPVGFVVGYAKRHLLYAIILGAFIQATVFFFSFLNSFSFITTLVFGFPSGALLFSMLMGAVLGVVGYYLGKMARVK